MNFDLSRFADVLLAPVADAMAALRALGAWGEEEDNAAPSDVAARARALLAAMEAEEDEEEDGMVMGEGLPERVGLPAPAPSAPKEGDGLEEFEVVDAARVALAYRRLAAWRAGYNPYQQLK